MHPVTSRYQLDGSARHAVDIKAYALHAYTNVGVMLRLKCGEKAAIMFNVETAPPLLTTREAGARLRLEPRTVRAWVGRGWLNPVRLTPRTLRFRSDEIERIALYGRDGASSENQLTREPTG
jgi:hypothetical protein